MLTFDFRGKAAFVTGAAARHGRRTARAFAEASVTRSLRDSSDENGDVYW